MMDREYNSRVTNQAEYSGERKNSLSFRYAYKSSI